MYKKEIAFNQTNMTSKKNRTVESDLFYLRNQYAYKDIFLVRYYV